MSGLNLPALDLSAPLPSRERITLPFGEYTIATAADLPFFARKRLAALDRRVVALEAIAADQTTEAHGKEYDAIQRELAALVVPDAPEAEMARLDLDYCTAICVAYVRTQRMITAVTVGQVDAWQLLVAKAMLPGPAGELEPGTIKQAVARSLARVF
jgi:hypothetical protein